jgi:ring-1,2-phenylacetyl-CoA epoxidase subunit PaaE
VPERVSLPIRELLIETPRTRLLRLALGGRPFAFKAGQAVLAGTADQNLRKPYSIACAPEQVSSGDALELLVQVDEHGSAAPHLTNLEPGRIVEVEGPYGSFVFPPGGTERHVLFVAGGTGIAPIRSILWHVLLGNLAAKVAVIYTARAPREIAFAAELEALAQAGRVELRMAATREADRSFVGVRGRIDSRDLAAMLPGPGTLCFLCGPSSLLENVPPMLRGLGVPADRILMESWREWGEDVAASPGAERR